MTGCMTKNTANAYLSKDGERIILYGCDDIVAADGRTVNGRKRKRLERALSRLAVIATDNNIRIDAITVR